MPKILFLTTAHHYDDDRIFYHQAKELAARGCEVMVCSLSSDMKGKLDGIDVAAFLMLEAPANDKLRVMTQTGNHFAPDVIICSEPLAVVAAGKIAKHKTARILYDITEWYPSRRMLLPYPMLLRPVYALKFFAVQMYAGWRSNGFIFGENTKKFPLAYLFPCKKQMMLPYYPAAEFVQESLKTLQPNFITLCYTGRISKEDGIENFFKAVAELQKRRPRLHIRILIIGAPKKPQDQVFFKNLIEKYRFPDLILKSKVPFKEFTAAYAEADLCFDLREVNFEYNRCLPIKLFYYIASGKPVIYSRLSAIEKHLDISPFGHLVNPEDVASVADIIENDLDHPEDYAVRAKNARRAFEEQFNWKKIRERFTQFVTGKMDEK